MAEFVLLPIYSEDGMVTSRSLKVDLRHFLGSASSETAHRFMEVVDDYPLVLDSLDRIVSGLAPRVAYKKQKVTDDLITDPVSAIQKGIEVWQDEIIKDARLHNVALVKGDVGMGEIKPDWWRTIPGFSNYELSTYRAVANKADGKSVSIMKGRTDNVLLTNDEGESKRMSIDFLMQKTFPELHK